MRTALDDCTTREGVSSVVREAQAIDKDISLTIARDFRFQTVMHLRANQRYHAAIRTEITDALSNSTTSLTHSHSLMMPLYITACLYIDDAWMD
jgi:hypothetical protein